jgi:Zn-dependent protease
MSEFNPGLIVHAFIWYFVLLFSTTCHEASHALASKLQGDDTAAAGGQITLNPMPHIQREPYGMVVFPILSLILTGGNSLFGWASAPYDPEWAWRHPRKAALMALAGPVANFILMFLAVGAIHICFRTGAFAHPQWGEFLDEVLGVMFSLNLLLGIFNLIPVAPLDGSGVIMLFMSDKTARKYSDWLTGGNLGWMGLIAAMVFFRYAFPIIHRFAVDLLL